MNKKKNRDPIILQTQIREKSGGEPKTKSKYKGMNRGKK